MRAKITYKGPALQNTWHPETGGWDGTFKLPAAGRDEILEFIEWPCTCNSGIKSKPRCQSCAYLLDVELAIASFRNFQNMLAAEPLLQDVRATLKAIAAGKYDDKRRTLRGLDPTTMGMLTGKAHPLTNSRLRHLESLPDAELQRAARMALRSFPRATGGRPRKDDNRALVAELTKIYRRHIGEPTSYSAGLFADFVAVTTRYAMAPHSPLKDPFKHYTLPAVRNSKRRRPTQSR